MLFRRARKVESIAGERSGDLTESGPILTSDSVQDLKHCLIVSVLPLSMPVDDEVRDGASQTSSFGATCNKHNVSAVLV